MAEHKFHQAIGRLISESFSENDSLTILKDSACDLDKRPRIPLYRNAAGTRIRYCDVDILIATDEGAKVIIEIEESNVKPINILGKFFASVFSSYYQSTKVDPKPLAKRLLFIQVLDSSKLKEASGKREQWDSIADLIRINLRSAFLDRKWEYELFIGRHPDVAPKNKEGHELVPTIKTFLEQKPRL